MTQTEQLRDDQARREQRESANRKRIATPPSLARKPGSALFPHRSERMHWDDMLTRELAFASERAGAGPVSPTLDFDGFRKELAGFDFRGAESIDRLLPWVIAQMEHGNVQITHPRYLGLFNPAPTFPAQCADRVTAAFNPQLASATTAPVAVAIENHTIRAIAQRMGMPSQSAGHFTTGGTEANYTALLCALTRACPKFAVGGARALPGPPVFYASGESHLAWLKIAQQAGIGRLAARLIRTDGYGRMDVDCLDDTIKIDRARGFFPVMIIATAGTTAGGMIDPIGACVEISRRVGAWCHVDAAWGGGLIASDGLRHKLAGIELADSVTLDAHKWFATTMGCGMFITAQPSWLTSVFGVSTDFMPPSDRPELDPYTTSLQWSRRFLGLRLFMALAAAGWEGYGEHIERSIALAGILRGALVNRGWRIVNDSSLAVLCVQPPPGSKDVKAIAARVVASGKAWVSAAVFEGRDVIRACVTNGETTSDDIMKVVDALQDAR